MPESATGCMESGQGSEVVKSARPAKWLHQSSIESLVYRDRSCIICGNACLQKPALIRFRIFLYTLVLKKVTSGGERCVPFCNSNEHLSLPIRFVFLFTVLFSAQCERGHR